jgi:hypothetical protein
MKTLDEQIDDIEKLDLLRQQARTLRQEAIEALTAHIYKPVSRDTRTVVDDRRGWSPPGDDVEKAEVLRALGMLEPKEKGHEENKSTSRAALTADMESIRLANEEGALDSVPIFRCAMILQAMAETPGKAFSGVALACFNRIAQELDQAVAPDWMKGAARASELAQATAFVTGECARALLALETVLLHTAAAAKLFGQEAARQSLANAIKTVEPKAWRKREEEFRKCSLEVSLKSLPHRLIATSDLRSDASELLNRIVAELNRISRDSGPAASPGTPAERLVNALKIEPKIASESDLEKRGKKIAEQLDAAVRIIRDDLDPMERFAESVIDREIAASHQKDLVDGAELVFAATLLGLVSDWKRPKISAAFGVLCPLLSTDGRLLSIRPFDVLDKGYRLNAATLGVARHLAELVANLDVEPDPEFIERLMLPFEYTRVPAGKKSESGWTTDPPPREPKSLWWLTAVALDALDTIVCMLDQTINRRVLRNFQVRQPETLKLGLDKLFYPDYGLASESVAITLQKLCQHAGRGPAEPKPLYSLILYGPPGTGKTTLIEAIAKTAGVPLIEVTPSDILVGGAEGMEHRARQVFRALSKLTHVVILFDEFDSILLDRAIRDPEQIPTSVVEFLTPGMLPKLKALSDASKVGRVSYVLATNFLDRIDSAVRRGGRFDAKCGIYPPDAISRLGRLIDQLKKYESELNKEKTGSRTTKANLDADLKKLRAVIEKPTLDRQLQEIVKKTSGGPMDTLGKTGWYSMPNDDKDLKKSLFGHLLRGQEYEVERETTRTEEYDKYVAQLKKRKVEPSKTAKLYWDQWERIDEWDTAFAALEDKVKLKSIDEAIENIIDAGKTLRSRKSGKETKKSTSRARKKRL